MGFAARVLGEPPVDSEFAKELRIQQAMSMVRQLPSLFIANPFFAILVVIAFAPNANPTFLAGWMLAMLALWSLPLLSWIRLRHQPRPAAVSTRKERNASILSLVGGLLWAVGLFVLYPVGTQQDQAIMLIMAFTLAAGALSSLPSSPRSCIGYMLPIWVAAMMVYPPDDDSTFRVFSAMVILFGPAFVAFAYNNWRTFMANVAIIVERDRLLEQQAEDITRRREAEARLQASLEQLQTTQSQLVTQQKMASLGQLTAGIAHEIKNPLNFVNNFAELSIELLGELKGTLEKAGEQVRDTMDRKTQDEIGELVVMLSGNLQKIADHGRRGDGIVKSMLLHSRGGSGEWQATDLNALLEESLNLAYHGARAQNQNFNVSLERDLDASLGTVDIVAQDITRVFLNLFGNGFYATHSRRSAETSAAYRPVLKVSSRSLGEDVEVRVRDNGTGIPPAVRDKLFTPFFTTKPTGQGTGLGLSLSYEIVVQQHRGGIRVESREGEYTEFIVTLPRHSPQAAAGAGAAKVPT